MVGARGQDVAGTLGVEARLVWRQDGDEAHVRARAAGRAGRSGGVPHVGLLPRDGPGGGDIRRGARRISRRARRRREGRRARKKERRNVGGGREGTRAKGREGIVVDGALVLVARRRRRGPRRVLAGRGERGGGQGGEGIEPDAERSRDGRRRRRFLGGARRRSVLLGGRRRPPRTRRVGDVAPFARDSKFEHDTRARDTSSTNARATILRHTLAYSTYPSSCLRAVAT